MPRVFGTVLLATLLAGCSTPGPLHVYSASATPQVIHDTAITADVAQDVPAFVDAPERVVGFAYDPFADHLFLRLAPGDRMRVVDRPARKIKREFAIEGATAASGDMAVRPRDGHVLLIDGSTPELLEVTRLGAFVRRLPLTGASQPPIAVAVDMKTEEILILEADQKTVCRYDADGREREHATLEKPVAACVGYDADRGELYAPLSESPSTIGVFDQHGRLTHTFNIAHGDSLIDAGPHSFFRMF